MAKTKLFLGLLFLLFTSCYSVKKAVDSAEPYVSQINWPETYAPADAGFFVHNEIEIAAPPEAVWRILVDAESWSDGYEGARDVNIQQADAGELTSESVFTWKTMGLDFESGIREFVPNERLSWESVKGSIKGYHAWLIYPTDRGCKLITDESQHGWLTMMEKTFQPKKLARLHQLWLTNIKVKSEAASTIESK